MKIYVLDTNVPLNDPLAPFRMGEENEVVIPMPVIEEIDNKKKGLSPVATNAREFARRMDALREQGSLIDGVKLEGCPLIAVLSLSG